MQKLAQNGYSDAEVLDVLRFKNGKRQITFRYDHLDEENRYLGPITSMISASIEHSYLDDIKTTMKYTIKDDTSIDFVNDRIKPWVRVAMPQDTRSYDDVIASFAGAIKAYLKFDETSGSTALDSSPAPLYNGAIGSSIGLNVAAIAQGSAFNFPGLSTAAGSVVVANGTDLFQDKAAGHLPVTNSWSHSIFLSTKTPSNCTVWASASNKITLGFDSNGNVVFKATLSDGSTATFTTQNPYGKDLRQIGVNYHVGAPPKIYLNGTIPPNIVPVSTGSWTSALAPGSGSLTIGSGFTGVLDAPIFFSVALADRQMLDLYRSGLKTGPFGNKTYAEWPQGVFLLDAPTRQSDTANSITRNVDGYDQLTAFSDDLLDTPMVIESGTLYTNKILSLVLNYKRRAVDFTDTDLWSRTPGVSVTSSQAGIMATLLGSAAGTYGLTSDQDYSLANLDWRLQIVRSGNFVNGGRIVMSAYIDDTNYSRIQITANSSGSDTINIVTYVNGSVSSSVTFTNTSNAISYYRMNEYNGQLIFQVRDSTSAWTTKAFVATPSYNQSVQFSINAITTSNSSGGPWSVQITELANSFALNLPVNIQQSPLYPSVQLGPWDAGTSKLSLINELLTDINYDTLAYDENGLPIIQPYLSPSKQTPSLTYADDDDSVTLPAKSQTLSLFKVPNVWIGTSTSADDIAFSNANNPKINADPNSPTSTVSRGRVITKVMNGMNAPNLVTLLAQIDKIAEQDSQVYETVTMSTAIMPIHTDKEVLFLQYSDLSIKSKYEEVSWSFDFKEGATMTHTVRKYVSI